MKIAIYVKKFKPESGGAHSFNEAILASVVKHALIDSSNDFYFVGDRLTLNQFSITFPQISMNKFIHLDKSGKFDRVIRGVQFYSPIFRRIWFIKSNLARLLSHNKIELVWYVSTAGYEVLDIPYMCTQWDIDHLVKPYFPEFSSDNTWDDREQFYSYFLRRASGVFCGTEVGRQELVKYYKLNENNVYVNPLPAIARSCSVVKTDLEFDKIISFKNFIFYPAQFWPHKNHITLLLALKILREEYQTDMNLVLVGADYGNLDYVKSYIKKLELGDFVKVLGFVERVKLEYLYSKALALVYPSASGPDNLPPLEAFSRGVPVICSKVQGAHEQYGGAALLVDVYEERQYAEKIFDLLNNSDLRRQLIVEGKILSQRLSVDQYVIKTINVINSFARIRRNWI